MSTLGLYGRPSIAGGYMLRSNSKVFLAFDHAFARDGRRDRGRTDREVHDWFMLGRRRERATLSAALWGKFGPGHRDQTRWENSLKVLLKYRLANTSEFE